MNFYSVSTYLVMFLHTFVGLILIGVILLQRGRGGGLAGAFGGMGGQSAFGTKAGDVFTKITIYLATAWILLGCCCVLLASNYRTYAPKKSGGVFSNQSPSVTTAPAEDKPGAGGMTDDTKQDNEGVPPGPANPPNAKNEDNLKEPAEKPKAKEGDAKQETPANKDEAKGKDADPAKEPADKKPE